ncbi:MAG: PD-(D/E)XK nuclease family transposase [Candidatus Aminicenantes bacterium]|nr:MAG: PD-(D/E)XK nuclease family transposase [Candidatus Aminicenantes bacterium]
MLAPLDNGTIFKTAFTDNTVFKQFVKDILDIEIEVDKIETEKKFEPKIGNIDITLDIFAESTDHRVIIEIQRIDYDYNFDRFLHYFIMAIAQLQKSAEEYGIERTVYAIVVLTAPYKIDQMNKKPIKDEVMITSLNPRNLEDKVVEIYGHKLIFLNHCYRNENTPVNYLDWLDLFYESIHNPENYHVNLNNKGIKKVVELIEYDRLSPEQLHQMKVDAQRKVVRKLDQEKARQEGAENERMKMAKEMKKDGEPIDKISKYTGLSKEKIEEL